MNSQIPSREHFGHSTQNFKKRTISQMSNRASPTLSQYKTKSKFIKNDNIDNVKRSISETAYNKWYINSDLRYKKQSLNPKQDLETLRKDDYVYENLHNR